MRSVKAALEKFSLLCGNIRPSKCRPFILGLIPSLAKIATESESDSLQESLVVSIKVIT